MKIFWLVRQNPKRWKGNLLIIKLLNSSAAFSFFHYVFLGERLSNEERSTILDHEVVHVKEKHSLDLLFFEILKIVFWFNPLVYIYQNRIRTLHEYIADAKAIKAFGKQHYYQNLLNQIFETKDLSFVNTFYKKSLLKKRIVMLGQAKSKQYNLLKYVLVLPMVFGMLMYTATYAQEKVAKKTEQVQEIQDLTLSQLFEKYYEELTKIDRLTEEVTSKFLPSTDKYLMSKNELARLKAFFTYLKNSRIEQLKKDGLYKKEDEKMFHTFDKYKTYQEYLTFKKTDEAKRAWDNQTKEGILRLVVDDLGNMTEDEQKRFDKKLDMIDNDDYFKSLMVVETKGRAKMMVTPESDNDKMKPIIKDEMSKVAEVQNIEETIEVPFGVIENAPTIASCKDLPTNEERKQCMSNTISRHVNKSFNTKIAVEKGLVGRQRINVMFKIDKEGNVTDIRAHAPHPALEEEAKRVIAALPQFIPGTQKGKPVIVPYSLPILFQVAEDSAEQKENVPFSKVEEPPVWIETCGEIEDKEQQRKCTTQEVSKYVNKKFNMKVAEDSKLQGVQRIVASFKIDKQGNTSEVNVKAPNKALEEETKRVIYSMPKFKPGKNNGEVVEVSYTLPIQFYIAE